VIASAHAATGALVAVLIDKPLIALPVAFASHFVLDVFPHFGYPGHKGFKSDLKNGFAKIIAILDPLLVLLLFGALAYLGVDWYIYAAALLAASPDIEWLVSYLFFQLRDRQPPKSFLYKFHANIQWCENPALIFSDLAVYTLALVLIFGIT